MLPLLILSSVLQISAACQKIPLYYGTLDRALIIPGSTTSATSSCVCCARCYNEPRCKSFNFLPGTDGGECILYSKVGGYPTFHRQAVQDNEDAEFYIMAKSSTTEEFCRNDDDCLNGEPCRGMVCTNNRTITCLTIKELSPETHTHTFWGTVNGVDIRLSCMMSEHGGGWTLLVDSKFNQLWTYDNIDSLNSVGHEPITMHKMSHPYSALW